LLPETGPLDRCAGTSAGPVLGGEGFLGRGRGSGMEDLGGETGASGRAGTSVRGGNGGGADALVGRPSASRNLRICSSSESGGLALAGRSGLGELDSFPWSDDEPDRTAFPNNFSKAAMPISSRNSKLSIAANMTMSLTGDELKS
jgi:hypothetical protein